MPESTRFIIALIVLDEKCACRKPGIELFQKAAEDLDIEFASTYMIGDSQDDIIAGKTIGCKIILITAPDKSRKAGALQADYIAENFADATGWILGTSKK